MVVMFDSGLEWWLAHGLDDSSAVASVGLACLKRKDSSQAVAQPVQAP
jgi:hypothetical protein